MNNLFSQQLVTAKKKKLSGWNSPNPAVGPSRVSDYTANQMLSLYNLNKDPYEKNDLQTKRPDIVKKLCKKMEAYRLRAAQKQSTFRRDPRSNPRLHGGVWIPWLENN